jgi:hypothetical protein
LPPGKRNKGNHGHQKNHASDKEAETHYHSTSPSKRIISSSRKPKGNLQRNSQWICHQAKEITVIMAIKKIMVQTKEQKRISILPLHQNASSLPQGSPRVICNEIANGFAARQKKSG